MHRNGKLLGIGKQWRAPAHPTAVIDDEVASTAGTEEIQHAFPRFAALEKEESSSDKTHLGVGEGSTHAGDIPHPRRSADNEGNLHQLYNTYPMACSKTNAAPTFPINQSSRPCITSRSLKLLQPGGRAAMYAFCLQARSDRVR
jgi:hypothetical protein